MHLGWSELDFENFKAAPFFIYFITVSIIFSNYLEKRQKEKIKQRIDRATINHIKDFFDYIESDKQFCNDVLQKEVKLYSFDREEIAGEHKYFDKLYRLCVKYKEYCEFSFVYDREGLTNMKDSPSDHGKEVFQKLIESRVHVKW